MLPDYPGGFAHREEYRIYACGGDGTLNEVASGAAGFPNGTITAYPGGSGNDFVKIFDDPRRFTIWNGCWTRRKRNLI